MTHCAWLSALLGFLLLHSLYLCSEIQLGVQIGPEISKAASSKRLIWSRNETTTKNKNNGIRVKTYTLTHTYIYTNTLQRKCKKKYINSSNRNINRMCTSEKELWRGRKAEEPMQRGVSNLLVARSHPPTRQRTALTVNNTPTHPTQTQTHTHTCYLQQMALLAVLTLQLCAADVCQPVGRTLWCAASSQVNERIQFSCTSRAPRATSSPLVRSAIMLATQMHLNKFVQKKNAYKYIWRYVVAAI